MVELFERYQELEKIRKEIESAADMMIDTYKNGGKILICGNGGSAADSEHIAGELMKGFLLMRPVEDKRIPEDIRINLQGSLPAISLPSQCAIQSAFNNDVNPDMVYAQLVYGYAKENDLVIGLSTSGNSKNVVNAIRVARSLGVKTISMTGEKESRLSEISELTIKVPSSETYKIQEYHLPVYHYLCAKIEAAFFTE